MRMPSGNKGEASFSDIKVNADKMASTNQISSKGKEIFKDIRNTMKGRFIKVLYHICYS